MAFGLVEPRRFGSSLAGVDDFGLDPIEDESDLEGFMQLNEGSSLSDSFGKLKDAERLARLKTKKLSRQLRRMKNLKQLQLSELCLQKKKNEMWHASADQQHTRPVLSSQEVITLDSDYED